jgi:hypothetical protein
MLNIPFGDDEFAIRAVGYYFERSGYIRNVAGDDPYLQTSAAFFGAGDQARNQSEVGDATVTGGRVSALWRASERLQFELNYIHQSDAADDRPFAQRGLGEYERSDYSFGPIVGSDDALETKLDIGNLTVSYRLPWAELFSSTSMVEQNYRRLWQIGNFYPVNGLMPPIPQESLTDASLFTEELRIASSLTGPVQFVAGVYYEDSKQPTSQVAYYTGDPSKHPFTSVPGRARGSIPAPGAIYGSSFDRKVEQIAGFGELSYSVTPALKFTGGWRHFSYDTDFPSWGAFSTNTSLVSPAADSDLRASESGNTFKALAEYTPTERAMVYAKFSQGFRLGRPKVINPGANRCDVDGDGLIDGTQLSWSDPLIRSDNLDSYEIGGKTTLLDGRAMISASAYHNEWDDIPVTFRPVSCPIVSVAFNVGKAQTDGFEIEGAVSALDAVLVEVGIGYVDSRLAETTPLGVKGAAMNFTPKWNGHMGVEYRFKMLARDGFLRGDFSYVDESFEGLGETGRKFDAFSFLNLSAGLAFNRLTLRVFADNVTGRYAISSVGDWPANGIYPIRPRTVGLNVSASF